MKLSQRVGAIRPSATMEVTARAIALRAKGVDVVSLGAGEPDFDTPEHIKEAAREALRRGDTKYTPVGGTAALREAIAEKLHRENGLDYSAEEVVASCGGKHSLYNAFLSLFEAGDEVIVPTPCWVSYPDMLVLAEATPVFVPTTPETGFKMTPEGLRRAINERTRGLILNSPSNPTGIAYEDDELRDLLGVIREFPHLVVISDDVYERILYDGRSVPKHAGVLEPGLRDRLVISNSLSKTYSMTGWRLGYTAAPKALVKAIVTLQGQSTSNPTSIVQAAGVAALTGPQDCVDRMVREFEKRRDYVVDRLRAIPGVSVVRPNGAFYVFPDVSSYFGRASMGRQITNGNDVALYLLEEANVAVVGGDGFEAPSCIRLSYATSMEKLEKALDRMARAFEALGSS